MLDGVGMVRHPEAMFYSVVLLQSVYSVFYILPPPISMYSYCREGVDGLDRETEFMFDLELPPDFIPQPCDGEVSQYYLWNIDQVRSSSKGSVTYQYIKIVCVCLCVRV